MRACMHVCALICERPLIAPGERVQGETMAGVCVQAVGTSVVCVAKFVVAVGLFCTTPRCLSSCLSFRLGPSILPPPVPLEDRLTWMRLLKHPGTLPAASDSLRLHFPALLLTGAVTLASLAFQQLGSLVIRVRLFLGGRRRVGLRVVKTSLNVASFSSKSRVRLGGLT